VKKKRIDLDRFSHFKVCETAEKMKITAKICWNVKKFS